ncbi:MAG: hypothetical protein F6K14_07420 [Symploca sp. SIO2C1]|nr:hypothetical protein [Symploca sp. SIO2C1]
MLNRVLGIIPLSALTYRRWLWHFCDRVGLSAVPLSALSQLNKSHKINNQ